MCGGSSFGLVKFMRGLSFFLWKLAKQGLPTLVRLKERHFPIFNVDCLHVCWVEESVCHLFFHCQVVRAVWFASLSSLRWDDIFPFRFFNKSI